MTVYREHIEPPPHESFRLLRWRRNLNEVEVCLADATHMPFVGSGKHWHAHTVAELTYIAEGTGSRFIGDHIGNIRAPELVFVGPNVPHYWSGLEQSRGYSIQVDFESHEARHVFPELRQLDDLLEVARRGMLFDQSLASQVGERMQLMEESKGLSRLTLLLELFCELHALDSSRYRLLCEKPFTLRDENPHSQAISKAIRLVVEHYHEDLTIEDLCDAVNISRATLCRHFKQYTGHTPVGFLNGVRIDHARRMLVEESWPISEIAVRCGFNNLSHFNRLFLRQTGATPSQYRNKHT